MEDVQIEILRLNPDDWKLYKELRLKALEEQPQGFDASFEDYVGKPDKHWEEKTNILAVDHMAFIAKVGDTPLGMISGYFEKGKKIEHVAELSFLYVVPEARRKGTGKKLVEYLIEEIKSQRKNIIKINLFVCSSQIAAVTLYESYGFRKIAIYEKERFVNGKFYDDYKMSLFIQ